jgi:hypothetical protein
MTYKVFWKNKFSGKYMTLVGLTLEQAKTFSQIYDNSIVLHDKEVCQYYGQV